MEDYTDRLQRALNAAARVISDTSTVVCRDSCIPSFIGWTSLNELSINSECLCTDASSTKPLGTSWITAHQSLTLFSASVCVLPNLHPRYRFSTYSRRALSVAGLTVWNSLSKDMHDPKLAVDRFRQSLNLHSYFRGTSAFSALEIGYENALNINSHLTFVK